MTTHPLEDLIPESWFAENYISREVVPGLVDQELYGTAHQLGYNVLVMGPTGPGKTSSVYAYAASNQIPLYAVPCNHATDPTTLFGSWHPSTDGEGFTWVDGPVTKMARHGGVLLLDEVNMLSPKIAAVLHSLLASERTIYLAEHDEVINAHTDLFVVGTMNPDYAGTRPLNAAFRNRFPIQLDWGYNAEVERQLVNGDTIMEIATKLRKSYQDGLVMTPVSTNMLIEFEVILTQLSVEMAFESFVNHFHPDERSAVRNVLEAHRRSLDSDYGVTYTSTDTE